MELPVAAAAAGVPPGVGQHQPAAAAVPPPAPELRHGGRRLAALCGAAQRRLPPAAAAGAAALRADGRPEEGDSGASAEAAGAEDPEGARLSRLQTPRETREGPKVRVPAGDGDQEGQGDGAAAAAAVAGAFVWRQEGKGVWLHSIQPDGPILQVHEQGHNACLFFSVKSK